MFGKLPPELLREIFGSPNLSKSDLLSIALVNSSWFTLAIPLLWRDIRPTSEWRYKQIVGLLKGSEHDNSHMEYHRYVRRINFREQPGHWMVPSPMQITPEVICTVGDCCTKLEALDLWFTWAKRVLVDANGQQQGLDRPLARHEYFDPGACLPTTFSSWLTSLSVSTFRAVGVNALLMSILPHCPRLQRITYWSPEYTKDYDQINEQTFRTITTMCPRVETLHLRRIDLVDEEAFRTLANLVNLQTLSFQWTRRSKISVAAWKHVLYHCNKIRELSLLGHHGLTAAHADLVLRTKNITGFACVPLEEDQVAAMRELGLGEFVGPVPYGGGVKKMPEYELKTSLLLMR
ncbi:hypothetical protein BC937DRAFT_87097 [Endogone sp. FLAS-F59071]|nr:hypothetical protein BC937DRAFT_87097 [Endogone sp. FLAS-F59071]|eukprot:RUS19687.1 hypothetical protein BC937DRAFT_87097 [Endogone sp. FLAS-F59071]